MRPTPLIAALLIATPLLAHDGVKDPQVMARMDSMAAIGAATKTLGDMAKGTTTLHQAKARMARDTIVTQSGKISTLFEAEATDPKSEALPNIWTDWEDFTTKGDALKAAAKALDFTDQAALAASMRSLGGSCGACHKVYRK
ncbi:c-type cytochrome [Shimia sp. Alg240-R146]|uniref:c-type cytochrome n=1 Tax=Shimia sp. Alg240-R146 TaxID=2993449 RepID=UPI0022E4C41F|nr:cytochrome c [Shimia sp. Alg240-R146]